MSMRIIDETPGTQKYLDAMLATGNLTTGFHKTLTDALASDIAAAEKRGAGETVDVFTELMEKYKRGGRKCLA